MNTLVRAHIVLSVHCNQVKVNDFCLIQPCNYEQHTPTFMGNEDVPEKACSYREHKLRITDLMTTQKDYRADYQSSPSIETSKPITSISKRKRNITFSTVQIREYDVVVGDHPSCKDGLPLAIGWNYKQERSQKLDTFETSRKGRRSTPDLILSAKERWSKLANDGGYTEKELFMKQRSILLQERKAFFSS